MRALLTRARHVLDAHSDKLAVAAAVSIAILSFLPRSTAAGVPVNDTVNHLLAYTVLSGLALWRRRGPRAVAATVAMVIAFGGAIELIQPYVGRAAGWSDFISNSVGAAVGLLLVNVSRRIHWTETP